MPEDMIDKVSEYEEAKIIEGLKAAAIEGSRAKNYMASPEWAWFNNIVLKSIEDEAIETLRKSKTEEDRIKSQQMFLAADKPRQILKYLVKQGEAAEMQLLSTRQNGG
jgi:hypothetical protein